MKNTGLFDLVSSLVRIPSPYYHEAAVMEYAAAWLAGRGVTVQRHRYHEEKITDFHGENLVAVLEGEESGPTICLNGHLDTVPVCQGWQHDPFAAAVEGDRLYGLGAVDMKSGCAAQMSAFARLAGKGIRRGKVFLTLVSDEEGPWGLGCDFLLSSGLLPERVDCSISCEPSAGFCGVEDAPVICPGAMGNYVLTAEFFGKAAHASQPELGVNAAVEAGRFLAAVRQPEKESMLGKGRFCVLKVQSDGGSCSVPDRAAVTWQRHLNELEDFDELVREAEGFMRDGGVSCPYTIDVRPYPTATTRGYPPYAAAPDDPWLLRLCRSVKRVCGQDARLMPFSSIGDFNYLADRLHAPCLLLGPAGGNFHSAEEYVSLSSLESVEESLYDFLADALC